MPSEVVAACQTYQ